MCATSLLIVFLLVGVSKSSADGNATTPRIDSFSPKSGPPGTVVVIKGADFRYQLSVIFSGNAYAEGKFDLETITVNVPYNAQTGPITVNTGATSLTTSKPFVVTAAPPPPPTPTPAPTPVPTPSLSPVITSATTLNGMQDQPLDFQVTTSHPVSQYTCTPLPLGLKFDTATGRISGTPLVPCVRQLYLNVVSEFGEGSGKLLLHIKVNAPLATVVATPTRIAAADGQIGTFVFNLAYPLRRRVLLRFDVTGTAEKNSDYTLTKNALTKGFVKIRGGKTSVVVRLTPAATASPPPASGFKFVKITLTGAYAGNDTNGNNGDGEYTFGAHRSAKIKMFAP